MKSRRRRDCSRESESHHNITLCSWKVGNLGREGERKMWGYGDMGMNFQVGTSLDVGTKLEVGINWKLE